STASYATGRICEIDSLFRFAASARAAWFCNARVRAAAVARLDCQTSDATYAARVIAPSPARGPQGERAPECAPRLLRYIFRAVRHKIHWRRHCGISTGVLNGS